MTVYNSCSNIMSFYYPMATYFNGHFNYITRHNATTNFVIAVNDINIDNNNNSDKELSINKPEYANNKRPPLMFARFNDDIKKLKGH